MFWSSLEIADVSLSFRADSRMPLIHWTVNVPYLEVLYAVCVAAAG